MSNKRFSGILITSDFDDTFFDRGFIPERNLNAINYFMENGGYFTINTARSVDSLQEYLPMFSINAPASLCNGAIIYDYEKQQIVESHFIDPHALTVTKEVFEKFENVRIELFTDTGLAIARELAIFDEKTQSTRPKGKLVDIHSFNEPMARVLFIAERETIEKVADYAVKRTEGKYDHIHTSNRTHCIMPCGASKGSALVSIANMMNIDIENTYGIGDSYNDIDMMKAAGTGVCPSNASEKVKEVCDHIVCDMMDGAVADLIELIDRKIMKGE